MIVVVPGGGIAGVQYSFVSVLPGDGFGGGEKVSDESGFVHDFGVGRFVVGAEIGA